MPSCPPTWPTGLLGHLVGPTGRVVGVELVPGLAEEAALRLERSGMPWATVEVAAPGVLGRPEEGPYDRILVSAMARQIPEALAQQLADGGRMVVPVDGWMLVVGRHAGRVTSRRVGGSYRFVPVRGDR